MNDYTRADAEADEADERTSDIKKDLISNDPIYAWKRRVVDAVHAKAAGIRYCHQCMGITDMTEVQKLYMSVKHLDKWLDETLNEELAAAADAESERRAPYAYRGLSRSDFY